MTTETPPVLLVGTDRTTQAVDRVAGLVDLAVDHVTDMSRHRWETALFVLVDAAVAYDPVRRGQVPRHTDMAGVIVVVAGPQPHHDDPVWEFATSIGADEVVALPDGDDWLAERLRGVRARACSCGWPKHHEDAGCLRCGRAHPDDPAPEPPVCEGCGAPRGGDPDQPCPRCATVDGPPFAPELAATTGRQALHEVLRRATQRIRINAAVTRVASEMMHTDDLMGTASALQSAHEGYGVLAEEMLELLEAIHANDPAAQVREAVQIAAVAARWSLDLADGPTERPVPPHDPDDLGQRVLPVRPREWRRVPGSDVEVWTSDNQPSRDGTVFLRYRRAEQAPPRFVPPEPYPGGARWTAPAPYGVEEQTR